MVDVLLIEDHEELTELLCEIIQKRGLRIETVSTGEEGLAYLRENQVKLVLLDIMLPGIDGFYVCDSIRKINSIPIIMLSAKVGKEDKIEGLKLGADDYVEKPVDADILVAKINALLRRNYEFREMGEFITIKNITMDKATMTVYKDGEPVYLAGKEYELLKLLFENMGKTLNKDWIFNQIWGTDSFSENQTLTVHINKLREKLETNPKKPEIIKTVWGIGYRCEGTV